MTVYAVRKRDGQWAVCSAQSVTMLFESYEEALEIARTAAGVIARSAHPSASEEPEPRPQDRYHWTMCSARKRESRATRTGVRDPGSRLSRG